jgi:hypothetical protein
MLPWNGKAWVSLPSPNVPFSIDGLAAVAASSPGSAWAVGTYREDGHLHALAIHCC